MATAPRTRSEGRTRTEQAKQALEHNTKRIAKNTLLLYCRMLLTMAISLYTSRVVLNTLGVTDYGIYNVVGGMIALFYFIGGSMSTATQRFITFAMGREDEQYLRKVFSMSVQIHFALAILIVVLAETAGLWFMDRYMQIPHDRAEAALWVFQFSVLSCCTMLLCTPYNATIIAHERMQAFAYISVLEAILKLAIAFSLLAPGFDKLKLYALLMFSVQMLIRLVYGYYCRRNFKETRFKFQYDRKLAAEMTSFASWNLLGSLAYVAHTQGVNVLLNVFFGPAVNAARAVAVQVQGAVASFYGNVQTAINPQITKSYAQNDLPYMHSLTFKSSRFSFFIVLTLALPLFMEPEFILRLWLTTVPDHTVNFLRLVLITVMIDSLSNPMMISAQATGRIKVYQMAVGGLLLFILPASYVALKAGFPPEAMFVVHIVFSIAAQACRVILVARMTAIAKTDYCKNVLWPLLKVSIVAPIVPLACKTLATPDTIGMVMVCATCLLSSAFAIYRIGCDDKERSFAKQHILQFIRHEAK